MAGNLSLDGVWQLTWAEGSPLVSPTPWLAPGARGRGWLDARVPCPVHRVLEDAQLIDDPNLGLNSLKARWIEEQFWVYRRTFTLPEEARGKAVWLRFDCIEYDAEVFLNGQRLGRHANAHRPAVFRVDPLPAPAENNLTVCVTSGLHGVSDRPGQDYDRSQIGQIVKRHWMRKAQYQCGWDWNARLMNVGIVGSVRLEWAETVRMAQVGVSAVLSADLSTAWIKARVPIENPADSAQSAMLTLRVPEARVEASARVELPAGEHVREVAVSLANPRLWWPRGFGVQELYTAEVTLMCAGEEQSTSLRFGVRRVTVDQSPHPEGGRHFIVRINNQPIFLRGGNWVPSSLMPGTVSRDRYRELVELAVGANFNCLRIWGGGVYADHDLCELCDETGIVLWHDFAFACSKYPGDDPEFCAEVCGEVEWVVRELACHPSLAVWCGNNEIEWGDWAWGYDTWGRTHPHYALFHHDFPAIVRRESPSVFYWPSSPYSPDGGDPNDPLLGDQHPWSVSLGEHGPDWWAYRGMVDRFPNEGGVLGASSPATLRAFLPEGQRRLFSPSWEHHDNPFACQPRHPGELGRAYETVRFWTGLDPLTMAWEEYAFVSALLQAEGLQEYIANFRRRKFGSASAIFWMYNDSWPVTHGWTIVDYFLRRKLSYHSVRRAFQPVTVVVALDGDTVCVYGINDEPGDWHGRVRYGLFELAGGFVHEQCATVELAANAATELGRFDRRTWEAADCAQTGAFAVLESDSGQPVAQYRLFTRPFHELAFARPEIQVERTATEVIFRSDVYVWGVCLDVDGEMPLADNCFDLLPGVPYPVPWPGNTDAPSIVRIGSRDAVLPGLQPR